MKTPRPFDPQDGPFAKNIRSTTNDDDDDYSIKLRDSLKDGWVPEFPAYVDENDVVLVGHRRLRIAKELGIEPVIIKLIIGDGDEADMRRFRLAIASNTGGAPMSITCRRRLAKYLYGKSWNMARISQWLGVSTMQISRDLEGFNTTLKPPRPKGGRPKNRHPRKVPDDKALAAATAVLDKGKTHGQAGKAVGIGETAARMAVAKEEGRREIEGTVDPTTLSMTNQKKFEALKRQYEREFEERVRREAYELYKKTHLAEYNRVLARCNQMYSAQKGVFKRDVYRQILAVLHPDSGHGKGDAAFNAFKKAELVLCIKEDPNAPPPLPETLAELMAAKRQKQQEDAAKRAARKNGGTP